MSVRALILNPMTRTDEFLLCLLSNGSDHQGDMCCRFDSFDPGLARQLGP